MNELIKVNYDTEHPTVSARELHKALEVSSRFSRWFDTNKEMFVDGEDYNKCTSSTVVNNGAVINSLIIVDIEYGKAFRNGRLFDCPK